MGGRIPESFIDELLRRTDIVDLVGSRLRLKKVGSNYQALCPFHNEKSPSFNINPDKQFYHCFGCGASGSAIRFLMEYDNLAFVEAVEELAQRAGLQVPREAGHSEGPDYSDLYALLERASRQFQTWLRNHPQAQQAVDYLKGRGLSGEIAAEYQLGYAPAGWDNLKEALAGQQPEAQAKMVQAGLLTRKDPEDPTGRAYDRFRDRIIFPIRDARGHTIGFGGRVMGDDKPKYLNSPETPLFHKGRELYGLYEARKAMRRIESILVVEGYMDVIALAQYGLRNCVATLGTATTADHLERLFRIVNEVVFCFDGDQAGRDAAWKALHTALPLMRDGRDVRFLFLPDGEDPDSLVRVEGRAGLEQRIGEAMPLSEYLLRRLQESNRSDSMEGRARLAEEAKPLLARLPAGIYRRLLQARLNEVVGVAIAAPAAEPVGRKRSPLRPQGDGDRSISLQRKAITQLIQFPAIALQDELAEGWRALQEPGVALLGELIDLVRTHPDINTARLLEHWAGRDEHAALARLAAVEIPLAIDVVAAEFRAALQRMEERRHKLEWDRQIEVQLGQLRGNR